MKSAGASCNQDITFENFLNDLFSQITELLDISTGSGDSAEVMAKTLAAVHTVNTFLRVCRNSPENLHEIISALRCCALEAGRPVLKGYGESQSSFASSFVQSSFSDTADDLFISILIDGKLQRDHTKDQNRETFKGYGDTRRAAQSSKDIQGKQKFLSMECIHSLQQEGLLFFKSQISRKTNVQEIRESIFRW